MSERVSGQAAAACAKGSLSGFTHAVSFRAQRSETTGYAAIQSAAERPAMHLSGETIADPPLYIEVWIEADECARQVLRALNVLNIKVFIGIVNRLLFAPGGSEHYMLGGYKLLLGQPSGRVGNLWKESSTLPKNLVKKLAFCRFCVKYTRINTKNWHCAYCYFTTDILEYKQEERAGVLRVPHDK